MASIRLHTDTVYDTASFHAECQRALGFPEFYGANWDAWIDCMSDLRHGNGMVGVRLGAHEMLDLELTDTGGLRERAPEVLEHLPQCAASVNRRYAARGDDPVIALVFL